MKTKTRKAEIEALTIEHIIDNDVDTSFMGWFSDIPEKGAIHHRERENGNNRVLEWFNPANPEYAEQEYDRMMQLENQSFCFIGIRAVAEIKIPSDSGWIKQIIQSPGLWGIESDSDDAHFKEVATDELIALKDMLLALNVDLSRFMGLSQDALDADPVYK